MNLPQHVQKALGVTCPITATDLAVSSTASQFAQTSFGLSGEEFAFAADNASAGNSVYSVLPTVRVSHSWNFLEILHDGVTDCLGVCTPENSAGAPPTSASQFLVGAWFSDSTLLDKDKMILPQKIVKAVRSGITPQPFSVRLLAEWASICPLLEGTAVPPCWVSKNQLQLTSGSRLLAGMVSACRFQDLFIEAVSEVKTKWRFLSLYRIFEHGYLSGIFETLQSNFFDAPKESLNDATKSIASELNQFLLLVQQAGLDNTFESIYDEFEKMMSARNRFALALERSFQKDRQLDTLTTRSQKGVLVCYKIRCAIVHAGVSAPIFDAFRDGAACLEALLPVCELAVLQFLGIKAQ